MKLRTEFYRLPIVFDAERMRAEALQFDDVDWRPDRIGSRGYWSLNLISHCGDVNEERQYGPMKATRHLARCPYLQQVIAAFDVVCAEVRLRRLESSVAVPAHFDSDFYWFRRFRLHVPITSEPQVKFVCNGKHVNMQPGEAWVFDRLQQHEVTNGAESDRIHLIIDTVGSATLYDLVQRAFRPFCAERVEVAPTLIQFDSTAKCSLVFDTSPTSPILSPGDVDDFLNDLSERLEEVIERELLRERLDCFSMQWRALWATNGAARASWPLYREVAEAAYNDFRALEGRSAPQALPTPTHRFYTFLRSGAFNPRVATESGSAGPNRMWFRVAREVSLRLGVNGTLWMCVGETEEEIDWTELVLLSQLAVSGVPAVAATAVGIADVVGVDERTDDWQRRGIIVPEWDDERPLEIDAPWRTTRADLAVLHSDAPGELTGAVPVVRLEVLRGSYLRMTGSDGTGLQNGDPQKLSTLQPTTRLEVPRAIYLRMSPSGRIGLWTPNERTYHFVGHSEVSFMCCLSAGKAVSEAAADARLPCDEKLLAFAADLVNLGLVSVSRQSAV